MSAGGFPVGSHLQVTGLDEHHIVATSCVASCHVGELHGSATIHDIPTALDSHADTCMVSNETALITQDFGRHVRVSGFESLPMSRLLQGFLDMWIQRWAYSWLQTYEFATASVWYLGYIPILHQLSSDPQI